MKGEANELNNKNIINMYFPGLFLNWKPKTVAKFLEFLMKNFTENKQNPDFLETPFSESFTPHNEFTRKSSFRGLLGLQKQPKALRSSTSLEIKAFDTFLLHHEKEENLIKSEINFEIGEITLAMVTSDSYRIGEIQGETLTLKLLLKKNSIDVSGSLKDLKLFDVTNYPLTDLNSSQNQKNNHFELLSTKNNKKISALDFEFLFIDDDFFVEDKIYNYIKISLNNLSLKYMQQPVLRIIDYLNDQILGVLTADYKLDEKIKLNPRRIKQIVRDPRFTDLKISINKCHILLLILPLIDNYLKISIDKIMIENAAFKDYDRIQKYGDEKTIQDFIFNDNMSIILNQVTIYDFEEEFRKEKQISSAFKIEINLKRILNSEEVSLFFSGQVPYDDSIQIFILIDSIKLHLFKSDYSEIMKILFNNLTYDDNCDRFVYYGPFSNVSPPKTCRN